MFQIVLEEQFPIMELHAALAHQVRRRLHVGQEVVAQPLVAVHAIVVPVVQLVLADVRHLTHVQYIQVTADRPMLDADQFVRLQVTMLVSKNQL